MRIIPVIDLRAGCAVRGRSGRRSTYVPVRSRLEGGEARDLSEPVALLSAYRTTLRPDTIYVADLDRIAAGGDNDAVLERLIRAAPEVRFLWDGGFSDAASIARAARGGRVVPVVGTETLRSIEEMRPLRRPAPGSRPVLSLDLGDEGVVSRSALLAAGGAEDLVRQARRSGFAAIILLLLHRVGTSSGLPRDRLRRLRESAGGLEVLAGGGVASLDDLAFLRDAGFSGALVATALHDGLVTPADLRRAGFVP